MKTRMQNLRKAFLIIRANLRLKYAIRLAERAHRKQGGRFYVMPDHRNRLIIMRRSGMRRLRRAGYMDRQARMRNIMKECFYCTADAENTPLSPEILEAKRVMYLKYVMHTKNKHG